MTAEFEKKQVILVCNTMVNLINLTITELPKEKNNIKRELKRMVFYYRNILREIHKKEPRFFYILANNNLIKKIAQSISYTHFTSNLN